MHITEISHTSVAERNKSTTSHTISMNPEVEGLTDYEMDCITRVFRSFETGLRQATILPKVNIIDCKKFVCKIND